MSRGSILFGMVNCSRQNLLDIALCHSKVEYLSESIPFLEMRMPSCAGQIPIYCSYATSRIIRERFPGVQSTVIILREDTTELLSWASPVETVDIHVKAYNANHCLVRSTS